MKIYEGIEEFKKLENAVVTSGTFDGVHLGHQKIIEKLIRTARETSGESVILTFWPHPRLVLYPEQHDLKLLHTFEEKAEILDQLGVDHLIKIHFTKAFSQLSSEAFIHRILIDAIGTSTLVIGYDHRFGKNREGSFDHLQTNSHKYGFHVEEIPRQDIDDVGISSSRVRHYLQEGNVSEAHTYLSRPYSLRGKVIKGDRIGRKIGFPTANISVPSPYKLIPGDGIYAVRVKYNDRLHDAMLYIGTRPTVDGKHRNIEVNIFDFDAEIYNEVLTVYFYEQIRGDARFESLEALQEKLYSDREQALRILKKL